MVGLWAISSTCHAQQSDEPSGNYSFGQWAGHPSKSTPPFPENRIIKKTLKVTARWQTITFEKPLLINRKGLMGLHLAVDRQLYISTMSNHPLNPKCSQPGCASNAFCLRRLSDGALIRPEAILIGDNGVEVKVRPAGHLYPNSDKDIITMALRTSKDAHSVALPFPRSIKAFKAIRIRGTEPFMVRYLYWKVDRYPFYR